MLEKSSTRDLRLLHAVYIAGIKPKPLQLHALRQIRRITVCYCLLLKEHKILSQSTL